MGKEKRSRKDRERSRTPEISWENLPLEPVKPVKKPRHEEKTRHSSRPSHSPAPSDGVASGTSAPAARIEPVIDTAAARDAERAAWRVLVVRLAALRGDPKVEALIARKHPELSGTALECGAGGSRTLTLEQTLEKARPWFERGLRGYNKQGPVERAGLCMKVADTLKAHTALLRFTDVDLIAQALHKGAAEDEGPLVCAALAAELEGSRFEGLWISREGPDGAYLIGDDHEGSGLPPLDEDGAPIAPRIRVLVKISGGKLVVDSFYHTGETTLNPAKVPVGPFLSVYFEGASLKEALAKWKGGPPPPLPGEPLCLPPIALPGASSAASSSAPAPAAPVAPVVPPAPGPVTLAPTAAAQQDPSLRALSAKLPPGWEIRESRSKKGVFFYANPAKGLSQMERPKA